MSKAPTILIVDDERTIRDVVRRYLEIEGYRVLDAADGEQALAIVRQERLDLVILDIMLPNIDGWAITRKLRNPNDYAAFLATGETPIILLTALSEEDDRLKGFALGADDYLTKPFSPRELVARVRAVLRRSGSMHAAHESPIEVGGLVLDPRSRTVRHNNALVTLTAKEFDLLWFFVRHPRQVFSRAQLLDNVWGYDFLGDESTVTVHVRRLREKIERDPNKPLYIQTVWGIGYKFELSEEA